MLWHLHPPFLRLSDRQGFSDGRRTRSRSNSHGTKCGAPNLDVFGSRHGGAALSSQEWRRGLGPFTCQVHPPPNPPPPFSTSDLRAHHEIVAPSIKLCCTSPDLTSCLGTNLRICLHTYPSLSVALSLIHPERTHPTREVALTQSRRFPSIDNILSTVIDLRFNTPKEEGIVLLLELLAPEHSTKGRNQFGFKHGYPPPGYEAFPITSLAQNVSRCQ